MNNIDSFLDTLDEWAITALYRIAISSKSTTVALALFHEEVSIPEATKMARVDENFQSSIFGVVEGAHDYDEIHTLTTFATS